MKGHHAEEIAAAGIPGGRWRHHQESLDVTCFGTFLTTTPNAEVRAVHPKAMPAILTEPAEWEAWLTAPWSEAKALQGPLPDGALRIVLRGEKEDTVAPATL